MCHTYTYKRHMQQHYEDTYSRAGNASQKSGDYGILYELVFENGQVHGCIITGLDLSGLFPSPFYFIYWYVIYITQVVVS